VYRDSDILTCALDAIKDTKAVQTYRNGKLVYERN
jgi:predicted amidohydrolase YtcJ